MALRWVLASAAALVAGAAWCPSAGAVVGGSAIDISQAPYQVAVIRTDTPDTFSGLWCGGSVRDHYHVITAAHCLFDNDLGAEGQPIPPSAIQVLAGSTQLQGAIDAPIGQWVSVKEISFDSAYNPATFSHDAAVLTLDPHNPLAYSNKIQPLLIADAASWDDAWHPSPVDATITGWGDKKTDSGTYVRSPYLQRGTVPLVSDADPTCRASSPGFDPDAMLCAGDDQHDACFGDSGGALVVPNALDPGQQPLMAGIVSFGPDDACALGGSPGGYTEVHGGNDIATYLQQDTPAAAPRTVSAPSLQGIAAVGSTVTCDPGAWDGSPGYTFQFVSPTSSGDVARTAQGSQRTYTIQPGDAGATLRCDVTGRNGGGFAYAKSAGVTVPVPASPTPPQQAPPQSSPPPPTQNQQQDSAAPVARVVKTSCTSTRCTLTINVTDAGFSAGIQTVRATVRSTYRTTCKRKGKKVACTKRKNGKTSVTALGATRFRVVASKLPVGKQLFTLVAVDKAGHRQALPTTKTVTTKKPKKKRR